MQDRGPANPGTTGADIVTEKKTLMHWIACGLFLLPLMHAQNTNRIARLEVEVENSVVYRYDVADPAQRALQPGPSAIPVDRAF